MDPTFQEAGQAEFVTGGGVRVTRIAQPFDPEKMSAIASAADRRRGGVLSSGMEYPGRYSRWHMAYLDPCLEIVARGPVITARALNDRGLVLLPVIEAAFLLAGTSADPGIGSRHAGAASTGPASTGLASTGLASTGLASTGPASTGRPAQGPPRSRCSSRSPRA